MGIERPGGLAHQTLGPVPSDGVADAPPGNKGHTTEVEFATTRDEDEEWVSPRFPFVIGSPHIS